MFCKSHRNDGNCRSEFGNVGSNNILQNALTDHAKTKTHKEAKQSCKVRELPSQMVWINVPQLLMEVMITLFGSTTICYSEA